MCWLTDAIAPAVSIRTRHSGLPGQHALTSAVSAVSDSTPLECHRAGGFRSFNKGWTLRESAMNRSASPAFTGGDGGAVRVAPAPGVAACRAVSGRRSAPAAPAGHGAARRGTRHRSRAGMRARSDRNVHLHVHLGDAGIGLPSWRKMRAGSRANATPRRAGGVTFNGARLTVVYLRLTQHLRREFARPPRGNSPPPTRRSSFPPL